MGPRQYNRLFLKLAPGGWNAGATGHVGGMRGSQASCTNAHDCGARTPGLQRKRLFPPADAHRWRVGLPPFPRAVPPPAPPTEERTAEILADPR
jgi:hypothetical protein